MEVAWESVEFVETRPQSVVFLIRVRNFDLQSEKIGGPGADFEELSLQLTPGKDQYKWLPTHDDLVAGRIPQEHLETVEVNSSLSKPNQKYPESTS